MRRIVKGARNVGIEYDGPQRKGHYPTVVDFIQPFR